MDRGDQGNTRPPGLVSLSACTVHSIVCDVDSLVYIDVIRYVSSVYVI